MVRSLIIEAESVLLSAPLRRPERRGPRVGAGDSLKEDCQISSRGLSCIEVAAGSPTVRNSLIHDGARSGIFVHDTGTGLYEDNVIRDCMGRGFTWSDNAAPTFSRNTVMNCRD